MITPAEARKIDPTLQSYSDGELELLLADLFAIGQLVFDAWESEQKNGSKSHVGVQTEKSFLGSVETGL